MCYNSLFLFPGAEEDGYYSPINLDDFWLGKADLKCPLDGPGQPLYGSREMTSIHTRCLFSYKPSNMACWTLVSFWDRAGV